MNLWARKMNHFVYMRDVCHYRAYMVVAYHWYYSLSKVLSSEAFPRSRSFTCSLIGGYMWELGCLLWPICDLLCLQNWSNPCWCRLCIGCIERCYMRWSFCPGFVGYVSSCTAWGHRQDARPTSCRLLITYSNFSRWTYSHVAELWCSFAL